jgi:hypothetical protein
MTTRDVVHPADKLTPGDTNRIYYGRVVDLAVFSGLLVPDPDTEIGHFAFSAFYEQGRQLDKALMEEIAEFEARHPEFVKQRRNELNRSFLGAVESFREADNESKIQSLILVGASHGVWPTGTSFTLTYPWDLDGTGRKVRFRPDLSEFTRRRIVEILRKAGKLRSSGLFRERPE